MHASLKLFGRFHMFGGVGADEERLALGVNRQEVDVRHAALDAIQGRISAGREDDAFMATAVYSTQLREAVSGDARQPLVLLLGASALVLLIACTNLASTLLARGSSRAREIAVRSALGARQGRLVRQLLTESVMLAFLGGALGLVFAKVGLATLIRMAPDALPRIDEVTLDGSVLGSLRTNSLGTASLSSLMRLSSRARWMLP